MKSATEYFSQITSIELAESATDRFFQQQLRALADSYLVLARSAAVLQNSGTRLAELEAQPARNERK
jgi:hypothetical protein